MQGGNNVPGSQNSLINQDIRLGVASTAPLGGASNHQGEALLTSNLQTTSNTTAMDSPLQSVNQVGIGLQNTTLTSNHHLVYVNSESTEVSTVVQQREEHHLNPQSDKLDLP